MGRLLIEGYNEQQVVTRFPVNAVDSIVGPAPDAGEWMLASSGFGWPFGRQIPTSGAASGNLGIENGDTVDHTFRSFLKGAGVPGNAIELTTPGLPGMNVVTKQRNTLLLARIVGLLQPGQTFEMTMQEALTTPDQAPCALALWDRVLQENLRVSGAQFGTQIDLINDGQPSILLGPDGTTFNRRRVLGRGTAGQFDLLSCQVMNRDFAAGPVDNAHTYGMYLEDANAGNSYIWEQQQSSTNDYSSAIMPMLDLYPNQQLRLIDQTPLDQGVDGVVYWCYIDFFDDGDELFVPAQVNDFPNPPA